MNARVIGTVARSTFREFWRTPEAVFWTYGFPLVMMFGLGVAFAPRTPPPVPVAIVAGEVGPGLLDALEHGERLELETLSPEAADRALVRGRVAAIVRGTAEFPELRSDPARAEAFVARLLVERALRRRSSAEEVAITVRPEDRPGSRYIDFLVPGLIGLNLMGACMWGIGFNLVMMRTQNLMRRLFVTPMRRGDFLLGYMIGRGILVVPEAAVIMLIGRFAWDVPLRGSLLGMLLVVAVGGFAFTGLGCLCASRARTYEGIAGLMNLCQLPMWVLGGALISNESFSGVMRTVSDLMPLSWLTGALRDLMLEPGAISDVALPMLWLGTFGALTMAAALRVFRWQ